jgi:hypothetical protein
LTAAISEIRWRSAPGVFPVKKAFTLLPKILGKISVSIGDYLS